MLEQYQVNDYLFDTYQELNDNLVYLDYISRTYEFNTVTINPAQSYRYQGNLFGLLRNLNVSPSLFIYTMYLNGYNTPVDFKGDIYSLKLAIKPSIPSS